MGEKLPNQFPISSVQCEPPVSIFLVLLGAEHHVSTASRHSLVHLGSVASWLSLNFSQHLLLLNFYRLNLTAHFLNSDGSFVFTLQTDKGAHELELFAKFHPKMNAFVQPFALMRSLFEVYHK
jgi:hypothetical protein